MSPPDDVEARTVTVMADLEGRVDQTRDPGYTTVWRLGGAAHVNADLPLDGRHYGWELDKLVKKGTPVRPRYAARVDASTSEPGTATHRNTIAPPPTLFVKLDTGYWGGYNRERERTAEPQREFGLIEHNHVWLCRFNSQGKVAVPTELLPEGSLIKKLLEVVEGPEFGCGIEVVRHTTVPVTTSTDKLPKMGELLRVAFPDIHLPERWPDHPPESARSTNVKARDELRKNLRLAQREPSTAFNKLTIADQEKIYEHLLKIHVAQGGGRRAGRWNVTYVKDTKWVTLPDGGAVPVPEFDDEKFSAEQFLAEKDILDRELMLRSCWFYAEMQGDKEPEAGNGDPTPAVDLLNLLSAIAMLQRQEGKSKIRVYQLGDLYELWMNREFLYRDFPVVKPKAGSSAALSVLNWTGQVSDTFQYRMDRNWRLGDGGRVPLKRYIHHEWPKTSLRYRHAVVGSKAELWQAYADDPLGSGRPDRVRQREIDEELDRLRQLLAARIESVHDFVLPLPPAPGKSGPGALGSTSEACKSLIKRAGDLFARDGRYAYANARGAVEYRWNRMILDALADVGCSSALRVYGNHDGYRGDPLLNGHIAAADRARPWISEDGVWFEHSHRWDDFNRDGMAFGAGVTNYVYYYHERLLTANRALGYLRIPWLLEPQEQASFMPGAAQWFLLVNFGHTVEGAIRENWFPGVKPFGIYVNGHTHHGDLVRIAFDTTLGADLELAKEAAADALGRAWESTKQSLRDLSQGLRNLLGLGD